MSDCEICRNHELCRLENKDKIKNCFYVYPNEEYLASKTKEYKLGYNKAIDDLTKANHIAFNLLFDDIAKSNGNRPSRGKVHKMLNRVAEQLKGE